MLLRLLSHLLRIVPSISQHRVFFLCILIHSNLWNSMATYASTMNCWKSLPDAIIILESRFLSCKMYEKYCFIVTLDRATVAATLPSLYIMSSLYPSCSYGNNKGYCIGRYRGCSSSILCKPFSLCSTIISRSAWHTWKSPTTKAAISDAEGRLKTRASVFLFFNQFKSNILLIVN